ncbi:hypothetical protein JKP88DRAFT_327889 [Tribonema minus]|uniref:Uncharacterized protein n=1 Tax=Tribonema minus TaxID=303371 RepID=A0A836CB78_9STRA|nr:hypothetical protein JKP88DRAFT_327889 [Tribonema minus]
MIAAAVKLAAAVLLLCASAQALTFDFDDIARVESYRRISIDVCDMRESFGIRDFADVQDVYENGRHAIRSNGTKRIPRDVAVRDYTGEKFYDDMIAYGFPASAWGLWVGPVVYGTTPYVKTGPRVEAGKSWARAYHVLYILHEAHAGLKNAEAAVLTTDAAAADTLWDHAVEEIEDAYGVFLGVGACAPSRFAKSISPENSEKFTNAMVAARNAGRAKNIVLLRTTLQRAVDALTVICLKATEVAVKSPVSAPIKWPLAAASLSDNYGLNTTQIALQTAVMRVAAAAFPFFKAVEAYVGTLAPEPTARMLAYLNHNCAPNDCPPQAGLANSIASDLKLIAESNGLEYDV